MDKLNLKKKRDRLKLSPYEVAVRIGVSVATVYRCERDDRWPENLASRKAMEKLYHTSATTGAKE